MKLYFRTSQIPELAGLTRLQRKLVYQRGLEACLTEESSLLVNCTRWLFGGLLGGALAGWLAVTQTGLSEAVGRNHHWLLVIAGAIVGVLSGIFVAGQIITAHLRPYLRRVLEERRDELAQIK